MLAELARRLRTLTEDYGTMIRAEASAGGDQAVPAAQQNNESILAPIEYARAPPTRRLENLCSEHIRRDSYPGCEMQAVSRRTKNISLDSASERAPWQRQVLTLSSSGGERPDAVI